jgi:hypothetical protein
MVKAVINTTGGVTAKITPKTGGLTSTGKC